MRGLSLLFTATQPSLLVIVLVGASPVWATQYYVSPTGSDCSTCGTSSNQFKTIQKAADIVNPGDIVWVRPGTYTAGVISKRDGTSSARIRFISAEKHKAVIRAQIKHQWENWADYISIEGFEMTLGTRAAIMNYGSHTKMLGNHIHHIGHPDCIGLPELGFGLGIVTAGAPTSPRYATDNDIVGNLIHDISFHCPLTKGGNGGYGIYHAYGSSVIGNNVIYRCRQFGIHAWHLPVDVRIVNNTVFGNGTSGFLVGGQSNNGTAKNIYFANNISYDNGAYGFRLYGLYDKTTIKLVNNLSFKNRGGDFDTDSNTLQTGSVRKEPVFVKYDPAGGGNYRLQSSSPAINAGVTLSDLALKTDTANQPRPIDGRFDIGAFEYQSSVAATPETPGSFTVQ